MPILPQIPGTVPIPPAQIPGTVPVPPLTHQLVIVKTETTSTTLVNIGGQTAQLEMKKIFNQVMKNSLRIVVQLVIGLITMKPSITVKCAAPVEVERLSSQVTSSE